MPNIYIQKRNRIFEIVDRLKKIKLFKGKKHQPFNDNYSVELFRRVFKDQAAYVPESNMWYVYDGTRWVPDVGDMAVQNMAKDLSLAIWYLTAEPEYESEDFRAYANRIQSEHKRSTMIKDARSRMFLGIKEFDKDPYLINLQNCVFDPKHFRRLEHDPKYYMTKIANVDYVEGATSPAWDKFLMEVMCGNKDLIRYLQIVMGYAMLGENTQEKCWMIYGPSTRNGKSTFLDVIEYIFGSYSMNIQPETLAVKDRNSSGASGDIARLDGCRFLHMSEPPKRMKLDSALLKTLLGGDQITARQLYGKEFQFVPVFKLFMNTNYRPVVTDDTVFSSGRIEVILFPRHFEKNEQDIHLKDKLKSSENTPGILNWMLEGLRTYWKDKEVLTPPEAVITATEEYREQSDKVKLFMNERLLPDKGGAVSGTDVYKAFSTWCEDNGYRPDSKRNFFDELRNKGLLSNTGTVHGTTLYNVVKDYRLDTADLDEDNPFVNMGYKYTRR